MSQVKVMVVMAPATRVKSVFFSMIVLSYQVDTSKVSVKSP